MNADAAAIYIGLGLVAYHYHGLLGAGAALASAGLVFALLGGWSRADRLDRPPRQP